MKNVLREVFDEYITKDEVYYDNDKEKNPTGNKYQFLKEVSPRPTSIFDLKSLWMRLKNPGRELYCKYNNIKVLNNKYDSYLDHEFK
jgi:hypothetical protein